MFSLDSNHHHFFLQILRAALARVSQCFLFSLIFKTTQVSHANCRGYTKTPTKMNTNTITAVHYRPFFILCLSLSISFIITTSLVSSNDSVNYAQRQRQQTTSTSDRNDPLARLFSGPKSRPANVLSHDSSRRSQESLFLARQYDHKPAPTTLLASSKYQQHQADANKSISKRESEVSYQDHNEDTTTTSTGITSPSNLGGLSRGHKPAQDICSDRLCYGLPMGCLDRAPTSQRDKSRVETSGSLCSVLVTSKRLIDPYRPAARDIHFELVALPVEGRSNYAAVGFSETGRMAGLVSECIQYRDIKTQLQVIKLVHSYNIPGQYMNVPAIILAGIKNLGVSYENGYYQCRWVVESAVEFSYDELNGTTVQRREDLGYRNYHILLATGEYNANDHYKNIHTDRVSSMAPVSLAQTGHIKSLGAHILIRIHGSLMIAIWIGLVTISVILARYYKNEWSNSKINDTAIWFVVHRAFMLIAWFGSIISVIFAYMYTETYHPGLHQISGTTCLVLSTVQVLGGLLRPSIESDKRIIFNWAHFMCGNVSYLCAMVCIVTAAFLAPAHLPPLYMWVMVVFVAAYALTHLLMTIHQYIVHKSSKISITPMSDLNDSNSSATYSSCGFVSESYPKEAKSSTFRQLMLGILVTLIVIFIVLLISLVNMK